MKEFIASKLGEVSAYKKIEKNLIEKNKDVLLCFIASEEFDALLIQNQDHQTRIDTLTTTLEIPKHAKEAEEKVFSEVSFLEENFLKGGDSVRSLVWFSMIEGASSALWYLLKGAGESLQNEGLLSLSFDAIAAHQSLADEIADYLSGHGKLKAEEK